MKVIISSVFQDVSSCQANEKADPSKILICKSFDEAMKTITEKYSEQVETIYAIGGAQIYRQSLEYPVGFLDRIYLTRIFSDIKCDVFMEPSNFLESFKKVVDISNKENFLVEFNTKVKDEKSGLEYTFEIYEKSK